MSYSSKLHKTALRDLGDTVELWQIEKHGDDSSVLTVEKTELPKGHNRGKGGSLYRVRIDGARLPEFPEETFTVYVGSDTIKGRALAVAAFVANLPRPILLDMIRDSLGHWDRARLGLDKHGGGRAFWKVSDGVPYDPDFVPESLR